MDNLQLGSNLSIDNQITNNLTYLSIPFIAAFSLICMSVQCVGVENIDLHFTHFALK